MQLPITSLYAAILAFMLVGLAVVVIRLRVKTGTSLFDGGHEPLMLAMRRHGNFAEYIPFALLLMALSEIAGVQPWILHTTGILLIAGRVLHCFGLKVESGFVPARVLGMAFTFAAIVWLAALLGMRSLG